MSLPDSQPDDETVWAEFHTDRLCDKFEFLLMAGHPMSVSDFLRGEGIDPAAADTALLRELARLDAYYRPDVRTRAAPTTSPLEAGQSDVAAGTVLGGRYKLVEPLGGGGMGEVWMAQQTAPVRRTVAVKVIKRGMDSAAVLARFDAERQALAVMDHPNIARVLDGGTTPAGRPFFVMELVKGVPITQFCDDRKLSVRERLALFVPVCQAIQHAHQKGVIHRDLKPSNVLVAMYDDRPVPRVIDFGIVKATAQPLTDLTLVTGFGAVVGTPEYMSPEQAGFNQLDIDTRSDVYALGVLLYELLTGTTPVDRKSLTNAALHEVLRIVREVDAPRPSDKLSSSAALPAVAALRGTEPAKLPRSYRGELDWVVLKALEKDRTRRYESANAVAADVQRYLANELVEARPPSAGYRLRKFVRRNRGPVLAGVTVLAVLLAGVTGTTLGLVEANRLRDVAETARRGEAARADGEAKAKEQAQDAAVAEERAKKQEEVERRRAERSRDRVLDTLDAMTSDVARESLFTQQAVPTEQWRFLQGARSYYQELRREAGEDEPTRRRAAQATFRVGNIEHLLGNPDTAEAAYAEAEREFATLARDFPTNGDYRRRQAGALDNLGRMLELRGKSAEAGEKFQAALTLQEQLAKENPADPVAKRDVAHTRANQAWHFQQAGDSKAAEREHRTALKLREELLAEFPKSPDALSDVAVSRSDLGQLLAQSGRPSEADKLLAAARDGLLELLKADPSVREYRRTLGVVYTALGNSAVGRDDPTTARKSFAAAVEVRAGLIRDFPTHVESLSDLAQANGNLANLLSQTGDLKAAEVSYRDALAILERLTKDHPQVLEYQSTLGVILNNYASLLAQTPTRRSEAEKMLRRALKLLQQFVKDRPTAVQPKIDAAATAATLGTVLGQEGRPKESLEPYAAAVELLEAVHERDPTNATACVMLAGIRFDRGRVFEVLGHLDDAVRDLNSAVEILPEELKPEFQAYRALLRVKNADVTGGLAEADKVRGAKGLTTAARYNVACAYSQASGKGAGNKEQHAKRAVELLRGLLNDHLTELANPKDDADFAPLRDRDDFKKLAADWEKAAGKQK